jgi:hypothetical protein
MRTLTLLAMGAMVLLSASSGAQTFRSTALVITSPATGTVVAPGQTVSVSVTVNSGPYPNGISIVGGQGGGGAEVMAGPLSGTSLTFTVTVPANAPPGPLEISALGPDSSGTVDASAAVTLDVERTDSPVSLRVSPSSMNFSGVGRSLSLTVIGVYADGSWQSLSNSSLLKVISSNAAVATPTSNDSIKAVGPGNTTIQVSYGSLAATVPIYVPPAQ